MHQTSSPPKLDGVISTTNILVGRWYIFWRQPNWHFLNIGAARVIKVMNLNCLKWKASMVKPPSHRPHHIQVEDLGWWRKRIWWWKNGRIHGISPTSDAWISPSLLELRIPYRQSAPRGCFSPNRIEYINGTKKSGKPALLVPHSSLWNSSRDPASISVAAWQKVFGNLWNVFVANSSRGLRMICFCSTLVGVC